MARNGVAFLNHAEWPANRRLAGRGKNKKNARACCGVLSAPEETRWR